MADIELVIKISEEVYTRLFDNGIQDNEISTDDICEMARALRLGKPLPKGHGDLIDRNLALSGDGLCEFHMYDDYVKMRNYLKSIPPIIRADKAERNAEDKQHDENIAIAFQFGMALGFAKKCDEMCRGMEDWTPVSVGLPKENKTVIASTKYGVYPETRYTKEYGWEWAYEAGADYWRELEDVTAWMPLPEQYKAESEDNE